MHSPYHESNEPIQIAHQMEVMLKYHLDKAHAYLNPQAQGILDVSLYQQIYEFYLQLMGSNVALHLQFYLYTLANGLSHHE